MMNCLSHPSITKCVIPNSIRLNSSDFNNAFNSMANLNSALISNKISNMIFAIKEAKKRKPYNGYIAMWSVNCMLNIYEYYIECYARANDHAETNFKWCKRFYDEVYKSIEDDISDEMLAQQYNDIMRNAYAGDKLNGIIPCMSIYEFLNKLKGDIDG